MGVPVIGTRVGGIPEIIEHGVNGKLVDSEDSAALTAAIMEFARDTESRRKHGEEGVRTAQQFGIERMGGEIGGFYEQLLNRER